MELEPKKAEAKRHQLEAANINAPASQWEIEKEKNQNQTQGSLCEDPASQLKLLKKNYINLLGG